MDRSASNSKIDCPSTPAAPWFAFTRLKASQTSRFGIENGFALSTRSSRLPVGARPRLNNAAPSLQPYYRAFAATTGCSAPQAPHRYCRPCGFSRLRLLPWHRSRGSHVPYQSLVELRAAYMPDAARAGFRVLPDFSQRQGQPPVLTSPNPLSTLHRRFACARLVWGFQCQPSFIVSFFV